MYVTEASRGSWGRDVIRRDALVQNDAMDISLDREACACHWNLNVEYNDGYEATWRYLCEISRVTLFWNYKMQETTATFDFRAVSRGA